MNLLDCYVTLIVGEPYFAYGKWWVEVEYESWGSKSKSTIMFSCKEDAEGVKIGNHFLS